MPPSPSDPGTHQARRLATGAWLDIGDGDFAAARTLLAAKGDNKPWAAAFHAQQAVEKWLKAVLVFWGISVPHKHDLDEIQDRIPFDASRTKAITGLELLNVYAVDVRYPAWTADPMDLADPLDWDDVARSVAVATTVREAAAADLAKAGYTRD
jgi:HEPN domain-containing protein